MKDKIYVGMLVSEECLRHYGKGHDDNPPGRGSGRWAYGSTNNVFVKKVHQVEKESSNNPLPLTDSPPNIKEVSQRGNLTLEEAKDCITLASRKYYLAKKLEPKITSDFVKAVSESNSKCYGLDHRLKTITSIAAKIGSEAKLKKTDFKEASNDINDTIRYTAILDRNNFKDSYEKIKNRLSESGYEEVRLKNYFQKYKDREAKHKAVQSIYKTSHGFNFEVQFQTSESQAAKELKLPLYNEARKAGVSTMRKMQLENEMERLADRISDPSGVYDLPSYDYLKHSEELFHYGKGHDDSPPGRGSGRYPWGSGERPKQDHPTKIYRRNADKANEIFNTMTDKEKYFVRADDVKDEYTNKDEYRGKQSTNVYSRIEYYHDVGVSFFDIWQYQKDAGAIAIGVRNDPNFRGKGYANKALEAGIKWFEENKDMNFLAYGVNKNNMSSRKLAEKHGFKKYSEDDEWITYGLEKKRKKKR